MRNRRRPKPFTRLRQSLARSGKTLQRRRKKLQKQATKSVRRFTKRTTAAARRTQRQAAKASRRLQRTAKRRAVKATAKAVRSAKRFRKTFNRTVKASRKSLKKYNRERRKRARQLEIKRRSIARQQKREFGRVVLVGQQLPEQFEKGLPSNDSGASIPGQPPRMRTGKGRKSITVEVRMRGTKPEGRVYVDKKVAGYMAMWEFRKDGKARPFLKPAVMDNLSEYGQQVIQEAKKVPTGQRRRAVVR